MIPTLADTNILLRLIQKTSPQHRVARGALTNLRGSGRPIVLVPQNLVEFWSVATRPVDARLAAAMIVHGIPQVLTFNVADFRRFPGITAIDPAAIAAGP